MLEWLRPLLLTAKITSVTKPEYVVPSPHQDGAKPSKNQPNIGPAVSEEIGHKHTNLQSL